MARYCICGCGKELKNNDGITDYDRMFFGPACRAADRKHRLRDQRAAMKKKKRCNSCTQPILPPKVWEQLRRLAADAGIEI